QFLGKLLLFVAVVWNKLMERWVDQPDGHWKSVHCLENADEVAALKREKLVARFHPRFVILGEDPFLDRPLTKLYLLWMLEVRQEPVLGAAEPNAFCPEFASLARVLRCIGVRTNPEAAQVVGPLHQSLIGLRQLWRNKVHLVTIDSALASIEG